MDVPRWAVSLGLAFAIVVLAKWLIGRDFGRPTPAWYAWPGMNPEQFHQEPAEQPSRTETSSAIAYTAAGIALIWLATPRIENAYCAAWAGAIGIGLLLHFGTVRLMSVYFRHRGFDARPLFDRPLAARSLGEFWGRRWNLAFTDAAQRWIFRPLRRRIGPKWASAAVFAASGLGHDLLLSVPAGGGYGGGTAYFALQWFGILWERRRPSRLRTLAFVIVPLPLLLHAPYLERVVLPLLATIGATS